MSATSDAGEAPWHAVVEWEGDPPEQLDRLRRAMAPEAGDLLGKSKVELSRTGAQLRMAITADSTPTLRAALNSYLRWLEMAVRVDELASVPASPPPP